MPKASLAALLAARVQEGKGNQMDGELDQDLELEQIKTRQDKTQLRVVESQTSGAKRSCPGRLWQRCWQRGCKKAKGTKWTVK